MPVEWVIGDGISVQSLFNKFSGIEIPLKRGVSHEKQVGGTRFAIVGTVLADRNGLTVAAMQKVAENHQMTLRLLFPDTKITGDENWSRVNVRINKGSDGKHRVGKYFECG